MHSSTTCGPNCHVLNLKLCFGLWFSWWSQLLCWLVEHSLLWEVSRMVIPYPMDWLVPLSPPCIPVPPTEGWQQGFIQDFVEKGGKCFCTDAYLFAATVVTLLLFMWIFERVPPPSPSFPLTFPSYIRVPPLQRSPPGLAGSTPYWTHPMLRTTSPLLPLSVNISQPHGHHSTLTCSCLSSCFQVGGW